MSDPIYVVAQVRARPGHEDALRAALLKLVEFAKSEPGFIRYDLHEDLATPGHFTFYEIWRDKAALDLHAATENMRAHLSLTRHWVAAAGVELVRKLNR